MKHYIFRLLLATLLATLLAACNTSRKVASSEASQNVTASVTHDQQTQSQSTDAAIVRKTETDFSSAVIEFTKVEYADGTEEVTTDIDAARADTVKQRDHKQTEPPNVKQKVKSVTSGRVILQNDKKTQTDADIEHSDVSQTSSQINSQTEEQTQTQTKVAEKSKRGFFYYFGIVTASIIALVILIYIYRVIDKWRRWRE